MARRVTRPVWPQRRSLELLLTSMVLLLATVLRVGWPTLTEFKFSEARLAALALELTREGHLPLVGVPSSAGFDHSPISVYLYTPPFLFTTNPIPATVYGGLAGVAAVLLCWCLARRWPQVGQEMALFASLLFAVGPWPVLFSRKIWQVAFVPLLSLACVGLMLSALVKGRRWNLAWALVAYGLLVQIHPSAISLAPALVLWLIVFRRMVALRPLLVGAVLGVLSGVPFLVHQIQQGWPALTALSTLPKAVWDVKAIRLTWEVITGRGIHALAGESRDLLTIVPQLGWAFNLLGWAVVGATLWVAWRTLVHWKASDLESRTQAHMDLFLLCWLVMPVVFNLRHSLDLHWHFFALVAPAAYLIVGRALGTLMHTSGTTSARVLVTTGLAFMAVAQVIALGLMGRFVATHDTPGGFGTPLHHYLTVSNQAVEAAAAEGASEILVAGQGDSAVVDQAPAIFDVLLRSRASLRFVDGQSTALFPPHRALVLLTPGAGPATDWYRDWPSTRLAYGYEYATLDGSWPAEGLAPVSGPRLFSNGVEIQSYAWQGSAVTGEGARLWVLWQVLWVDQNDTHFSVRLWDKEGVQCGQQDAVGYPTAYRHKGDRFLSKFDITPSPGSASCPYTAEVGLYLFPALDSLSVVDGTGRPVSSTVVLGPLNEPP